MKRVWKEVIIMCAFILLYCLLLFEHEQHRYNIIVKEIPYILILITSVLFIVWLIDKLRQYQSGLHLAQKMRSICNQYDMDMNDKYSLEKNCEFVLDQMNQQMKDDERNLSSFEYRYRKIADITNQIIFEYDLKNHTICDSTNWHTVADGNRFISETIARNIVHPEDEELFRTFFGTNQIVGNINEVTLRLRPHANADYQWTKIRGIVLEGLDGTAEKIIGSRTPVQEPMDTSK